MADTVLSTNLKLKLTPASETAKKFLDFRTEVAGDGADSDMQIIDKNFGDLKNSVTSLTGSVNSLTSSVNSLTTRVSTKHKFTWNDLLNGMNF